MYEVVSRLEQCGSAPVSGGDDDDVLLVVDDDDDDVRSVPYRSFRVILESNRVCWLNSVLVCSWVSIDCLTF